VSAEIVTADLAARINEAHALATKCAASAVEHAQRAGELLLEAKAAVKHGEWQGWLVANVQFSERSARNYLRIARELPLLPEAKRQRVATLPLRKAATEIFAIKRELKQTETRQAVAVERKESDRRAFDAGEPVTEDLWSSAKWILEAKAKNYTRPLNDIQRKRTREEFKASVFSVTLLDYLQEVLPESALAEIEARSKRFLAEAKVRATEHIKWIEEQRRICAEPILEAAASADDSPDILVGQRVHYPNGGVGINADVRMMGVPAFSMPHDPDGCDCERLKAINRNRECRACGMPLNFRYGEEKTGVCSECKDAEAAA
jgi:hypothetical protein